MGQAASGRGHPSRPRLPGNTAVGVSERPLGRLRGAAPGHDRAHPRRNTPSHGAREGDQPGVSANLCLLVPLRMVTRQQADRSRDLRPRCRAPRRASRRKPSPPDHLQLSESADPARVGAPRTARVHRRSQPLHRRSAGGTARQRAGSDRHVSATTPTVSPNGRTALFVCDGRIVAVDLKRSRRRTLFNAARLPRRCQFPTPTPFSALAWSPDAQSIAVGAPCGIVVMRADGSRVRRLPGTLDLAFDTELRWANARAH